MFPLTHIKGIVELTDLLYSKKFSKIKAYSLVIKHTVSTWLEWSLLMSASMETYQLLFLFSMFEGTCQSNSFSNNLSTISPCLYTNVPIVQSSVYIYPYSPVSKRTA